MVKNLRWIMEAIFTFKFKIFFKLIWVYVNSGAHMDVTGQLFGVPALLSPSWGWVSLVLSTTVQTSGPFYSLLLPFTMRGWRRGFKKSWLSFVSFLIVGSECAGLHSSSHRISRLPAQLISCTWEARWVKGRKADPGSDLNEFIYISYN